jgi:integrase
MPKPIKDPRSPYYQYDFQRNKRRFHGSTGCTSKPRAQKYIDDLLNQIAEGRFKKAEITLDAACLTYWRDKANTPASGKLTPGQRTLETQLATLCDGIGKDRLLSEITITHMRKFIAKRRGMKVRGSTAKDAKLVSNATVNREWELARRVWRHVAADHAVSEIKWGDLKLPENNERVRELSADEQTALFETLPDDLKPIVEFALLSGQRKSAVVGLRWDRINWNSGQATIVNKGGKDHTFPLTSELIELVLEQPRLDDCPFVFTYVCERPAPKRKDRPARRKGERYPFTVGGWIRKWHKALKAAGVTDFRFHDLRHTSATRIMRNTGNLKAAGRLLGHTDMRTTSRYAHVQMEDLREIMTRSDSRNNHGESLPKAAQSGRKTSDDEG